MANFESKSVIELFAGAGGLGLGISQAGFKPVGVYERDENCCQTIRKNIANQTKHVANWPLIQADIRDIDFRHHSGNAALVSGGPPCQPFSIGGKHQAFADNRDMFPHAVRAVREVKPYAFIFENVKGLTRDSFRNYFEYIRLQLTYPTILQKSGENWLEHLSRLERVHTKGKFQDLKYNLVTHVANAADYGVPQKRQRVFLVGFRSDLNIEWCFPQPTHSLAALAWAQYRDSSYWKERNLGWRERPVSERLRAIAWRLERKPAERAWVTIRDAISDLPEPNKGGKALHFQGHKLQLGAKSYAGHTGSPIDEPAKALKAGVHGVPGGENMLLRTDGSVRYFTVRESARLQTFPDSFEFPGVWTEAMLQLGNAVPVQLARVVAKDVMRHLEMKFGRRSLQSTRQNQPREKH